VSRSRHKGLVVGKFWPPHQGHIRLIEQLSNECDQVFVVVCSTPSQIPNGETRAMWMQSCLPHAEVILVDDFCSPHYPKPCRRDCSPRWASRVQELGIGPISVVATAETYGPPFAEELGARLLYVDREAGTPLSSSMIRSDLRRMWTALPSPVREGLHRKVVVLGAESTGTTTLAQDLSSRIGCPVTAEAGRTMSWVLFAESNTMDGIIWTEQHFWRIVNAQITLEHQAVSRNIDESPSHLGPWLVCDTDTLATVAWWERYLSVSARTLEGFASSRLADLYLVTSPDGIEFDSSDPLRDGISVRTAMHRRFLDLVRASGRPWVELSGPREVRLAQAEHALEEFEARNPRWVHA